MYKKHPILNFWISEDGFIIKQKGCGARKSWLSKNGYLFISHRGTSHYIHRLVYEAFYGEIPDGLQINHKNGIKTDNRLRNLELVTPSENLIHAVKTGLKKGSPSSQNGMAKLDDESYYQIISDIMNGASNDDIAEKFGLHSRYVSLIRGKKRLTTIWQKYETDHGTKPVPRSGGHCKLDYAQKLKVLSELSYLSNIEIAKKYGIEPSSVSRIRSKILWRDMWDVFEKGLTTS